MHLLFLQIRLKFNLHAAAVCTLYLYEFPFGAEPFNSLYLVTDML